MDEPAHPAEHYVLVTPAGELTSGLAPLRDIRRRIEADSGIGEAGFEHLPGVGYPIAIYYFTPYGQDRRSVNTVAGGMFWALSASADTDGETAVDPDLRKIRVRGPAAFVLRATEATSIDEQHRRLLDVHRQEVARLRAESWLPAPCPGAGAEAHRRPVRGPATGAGIAEALAADLRKHVHFRSLPADQVREYLSRVVGQWATRNGWEPEREAPAERPEDGEHDLLCRHSTLPDLVIEIERGNRRATADKLARAAASGHIAIWLRWAGPAPRTVPAGVLLIHLAAVPAARNGDRRAYTLTKQAAAAAAVTTGR
ncbi:MULTISPECIES: hypothetical protein [Streptomycetaceae]|uniref:hypothetical protein n=1 Tax=Streptomycetaceae TaxID=2062 RepID=UPI000938CCEE|nr:hypothetical protein [Streptomyces sp. CB02056]OKH97539.1 hypothetical protein AMK13_38190 [Streptomyces sp. CB02056]